MKLETFSKADHILRKIRDYKDSRENVTLNGTPDRPQHFSYIETEISRYNDNSKKFAVLLNRKGEVENKTISEKGKILLAHAANTFFRALQDILDAEISDAQKEFDNLKDE